jgi:phenylpropionate dioxygenase-like ring-hydroxylating dioxygenase large terminal subunit
MACRLEDIAKPGDYTEYEILDQSVIVVRVDESTVKAYNNACRHRGVKLVEGCGSSPAGFTCPFHGWCWGTDGANTFLYQRDLFDDGNLAADDLRLTEVRVETWGGCAFINFDADAPPLRDSIEPFGSFHDAFQVEDLRAEWWLSCALPVNWKLAMEAFMEGYHVMETHPQFFQGRQARGAGTVYRALDTLDSGGAGSSAARERALAAAGGDSRALIEMNIRYMRVLSEGMAGMTHANDVRIAEGLRSIELPADLALASREWRRQLNDAVVQWHRNRGERMPDLNAIDEQGFTSVVNFCFPHFFLLPTYSSASSYRIRPTGPESCIFDLWSLTRYPPGEEQPPPPKPTPIPPGDPRWPPIPHQDFSNLPRQQKGLHAKGFEYMRLSDKVEGMIANYHRLIDGYLAGLGYEQLVSAVQRVSGPIDAPVHDLGF